MQLASACLSRVKTAQSPPSSGRWRGLSSSSGAIEEDEILAWYLTLAPYGGDLEGVRAASLAYFGKEPRQLSVAEAALLVALPQSPESRRPDRPKVSVMVARERVLARMIAAGIVTPEDAKFGATQDLPTVRLNLPVFAAHVSLEAYATGNTRLTIDRTMQQAAETVAIRHATALGSKLSVAVIVADHRNGENSSAGRLGLALR